MRRLWLASLGALALGACAGAGSGNNPTGTAGSPGSAGSTGTGTAGNSGNPGTAGSGTAGSTITGSAGSGSPNFQLDCSGPSLGRPFLRL